MTGKHKIIVKNNRLYYELEIEEKITIIRGDSATGKTTLIDMIWQARHYEDSSGIELIVKSHAKYCTGITGSGLWRRQQILYFLLMTEMFLSLQKSSRML